MLWARMVACVTGTVNQELLLRNEYLGAENRILRGQIKGRLPLSEGEKATLAEICQRLGRKLESRRVSLAGMPPYPGGHEWMEQQARNATMEEWGFLRGCRYLLHDRDTNSVRDFGN